MYYAPKHHLYVDDKRKQVVYVTGFALNYTRDIILPTIRAYDSCHRANNTQRR